MLTSCYSVRQVYFQGNLFSTRKPVNYLIWSSKTDPKLKKKLRLVKRILDFARIEGLNVGMAYRTYIKTPRGAVSYLVQAAHADKLKFKKWWFPVVGKVPYLGYYNRDERDKKAKELRHQGYDVATSGVGAFSSLGWFDDPLFTSMLRRNEADLASLLFHELVHRTYWYSDHAEFNENIAAFLDHYITVKYLKASGNKKMLNAFMEERKDKQLYRLWVRSLREELKSVYKNKKFSRQQKLHEKSKIFMKFLSTSKPKFTTDAYDWLFKREWNNARVLGASIYQPDMERFSRAMKCSGAANAGEFLALLEEKPEGEPMKMLDSFCSPG